MCLDWILSPISQDLSYHLFADKRIFFHIPNTWDVISNIAFLYPALVGFSFLKSIQGDSHLLIQPQEKVAWLVFFFGVFLTALGSAYYHWEPNNLTLVWDRLPMTICFMALLSAIWQERVKPDVGARLLGPLLVFGILSVIYWAYTEFQGEGDLRPYILVQFGTILLLAGILIRYPVSPLARNNQYFIWAIIWYGLAKLLEHEDALVFELTKEWVSGHSLKHLAAAVSVHQFVFYLRD